MAEESHSPAPAAPAEEVVVAEVAPPAAEKEVVTEPPPPPPQSSTDATPEPERSDLGSALAAEAAAEAEEKMTAAGEEEKEIEEAKRAAVLQAGSFKEESNIVADLSEPEKKALEELKRLVQAAIDNNEFFPPPPPPPPAAATTTPEEAKASAEETKNPAEETKNPVEETETTAQETKNAVEETITPAEETKNPAEEAETPAEETKAPAAETKTAAEETETTAEESPKPPAEEAAPPAKEDEGKSPAQPPAASEEKPVAVEDDGAKTVEAIEETIVPVSAPAPTEPEAPASTEAPAEPASEKVEEEKPAVPVPEKEEVLIWGVPLLGDERSDTVLLKFLRARDFKPKEAMAMLKDAVLWRKAFAIEALLEEDLGVPELEKAVFMHGVDKDGHPVCYNVYGEFQNKELYAVAFADEEKRKRFLRWRIQFLEKGIRDLLDFKPGGVSTMVQITDLKNSAWLTKKEVRQALDLLQNNYPEFAAKQIFINVPWWYLAFNRMISTFLTQRTKSKFVFAGPSKSAETLFRYIVPEQVPVQYGGLSKENDTDFSTADTVTEINIKPSTKQAIEIPVTESCLLVWELRVLGWEVTYSAEFVPAAEGGYTVVVHKARKVVATDEPVVKDSFKVGEAGKVVITVDNTTSKRKKLLYRYKTKSSTESI